MGLQRVATVIVSVEEFFVSVPCRVCRSVVSKLASRIPPHFRVIASSESKKERQGDPEGSVPCLLPLLRLAEGGAGVNDRVSGWGRAEQVSAR